MDPGLRLAGRIFKFIIKKSMNMKAGEDKNKKSGNASKIVGSLVAGAAVGLAAGILLAPEKGKKTRAKLMEDAKDLADNLKKKAENGVEHAKDLAGKLKKKTEDGLEDAEDLADKLKKKAEDGVDSIKKNKE